jgi:lipopolysaccharide transport protein LptA
MKKTLFILLAGLSGAAVAQTNAVQTASAMPTNPPAVSTNKPAAKTAAKPATGPTQINSDGAEFDLNAHRAVYQGNVVVERPDVKLTCGWLTVDLPPEGGRLNRVVAETNVVIDFTDEKGQKYHVTSAKAVYDFKVENAVTNETVTFTGNPRVETAQSIVESEPMVWDRVKNKFSFTAPKMISRETPGSQTNNGTPLKIF